MRDRAIFFLKRFQAGILMKIKDVMTKDIVCVDTKAMASDAAKKMKDQDVGTVLVIEGNQLKGLVTDRAITTRAVAEEKDPRTVPITDIMTKELIGCNEDEDLFSALHTMGKNKIRRLPVVNEQSQLVGIVSLSDIAPQMKSGIDYMVDELTKANK
jgi:CBS domain-containing protein